MPVAEKTKEYKSVRFEVKQYDPDAGTLEGYANTWDLDEGDDLVLPGAFKKTIKERVPAGKVKLLDSHFWDGAHTIGTVVDAREDDKGLYIVARLASTPDAQAIRTKIMEGHLDRMSIGFQIIRDRFENDEATGKMIRVIEEVKLFEVSVVPFPMNEEAAITSVKSLNALVDELKAGRRNSTGDFEKISDAIAALFDVLNDDEKDEVIKRIAPSAGPDDDPPTDEGDDNEEKAAESRRKALTARLKVLDTEINLTEVE